MNIRAAIVDDEAMARFNIRDAIAEFGNWQVAEEFTTADGFMQRAVLEDIDVVFLDISMPGTQGTDAAKWIIKQPNAPLVVFVTAYDDYALQAFELYAVDYLLKPFDNQRFGRCVERVEYLQKHQALANKQVDAFLCKDPIDLITIKSTTSIRVIKVDAILWICSNGNYVEIHHSQGCHLHRCSLSQLEKHLDPTHFCRVHRQAIVKLEHAMELKSINENKNLLMLSNGEKINVSEHYKPEFIRRWSSPLTII